MSACRSFHCHLRQFRFRGGQTQIAKVLAHARRENDRSKVGALVFIGDATEENLDEPLSEGGSSSRSTPQ
jgi:hypothetical protein